MSILNYDGEAQAYHDGEVAGAGNARAEIVAKLRERAGKLTRAGEMGGSTLITDALMLAATELESFATELEARCPS